ncbi:MAG: hypothetical protein PHZ11_04225 [Desulfitobacteriaceae bacterium]|nr:hypothetical protein [Desulfitobacteriaceae bacterium]MDD4346098.1 hypothetical protein [Desulfitobacteriaceae bacterium]MDD4400887.1 hypothetical protein [Desulfitobacteriaceae bacterium]
MFMMNRHRRSGSRWMLHLAGIVGGFLLGRESEKYMNSNSGKRSSRFNESGSNSESGQQ